LRYWRFSTSLALVWRPLTEIGHLTIPPFNKEVVVEGRALEDGIVGVQSAIVNSKKYVKLLL